MKVDLTLLVPSWVLQYDTWRQFLEVLEQSINEIASNVDDLRELYDIEKAKEFVVLLARNFGFGEIVYQDVEKNVQLLDNQVGFIQWKGTEEFFKWLLQLFEIVAVFRDLSKEVLIWSGGRGWDMHVIEDAKYYRDGSVEVTVPVSQFWAMKELERFVSAGVYVWYMIVTGLQMLRVVSRVSEAGVGIGVSGKEMLSTVFRVGDWSSFSQKGRVEFRFTVKTTNVYMVANNVVPLGSGRYVIAVPFRSVLSL